MLNIISEEVLNVILGQIPEAIYFALFLIYTKNIKEKRILFTIFMTIEYLLLKVCFPFDVKFQISYVIMTYILLKILYKEKAQITDIFTFGIASLVLTFSCIILYFLISITLNNMIIYVVLNRIVLFLFLGLMKDKLYNIQKLYKKLWNRNDNVEKKMKSTTFRSLNIVMFNIMFYIINICMVLATIM